MPERKRMNCKEAEKMIHAFLKNELTRRAGSEFIRHTRSCESCKEELSVQYLATEGIQHLESGKTFDLNAEVEELLKTRSYRWLKNLF
jgi:arginyl-tRNA--protein-N-Asp/Glu arginylyltransferase